MTKSKTIREILIDYGEKCFYDGLEIDPNEDDRWMDTGHVAIYRLKEKE